MRGRQFLGAILMGTCLLLGVSGCWDQLPVETRAAVAAIGIDPTPQPGIAKYTFIFPNVTVTTSSLATTPVSQEFYAIAVRAPSLIAALQKLQARQSRLLYLGQVRIVALSTQLPPAVWRATMNALADSGRFVLTFRLVATPQASALVRLTPPTEVVPEVALYRALNCRCQSTLWPGRGWRVWDAMVTPGVSASVVNVTVDDKQFVLGPLVVIGSRVVIWPPEATLGWAYLTGHVHRKSVTVTVGHKRITVGLIRGTSHAAYTPTAKGIFIEDQLRYSGALMAGTPVADQEDLEAAIERAVAQHIHAVAAAAWLEAQQTGTDPMGWHRDAAWSDARIPTAVTHWHDWHLTVVVRFTIRDEGVLR